MYDSIAVWLSMLLEVELYVIQRHLIDGIDISRIVGVEEKNIRELSVPFEHTKDEL